MKFAAAPLVHCFVVIVAVVTLLANPSLAAGPDDVQAAASRDAAVTEQSAVLVNPKAAKAERVAAAMALETSGRGSSQAAQALAKTLGDDDPQVRGWAAVMLVRVSRRRGTDLAAPIEGTERFFRTGGAAQYGGEIEPALPILLESVGGSDPFLALEAAHALEELGPAASKLTADLAKMLKHKEPSVRSAAAGVLAEIGPAAEGTIPAITDALKDGDAQVRRSAASAIGKFGPVASGSVSALKSALKDSDPRVRFEGAQALVNVDAAASADDVVPVLLVSLKDHNSLGDIIAANALAKLGPAANHAVTGLIAALSEGKGGLRGAAAEALGRIGDKSAVPALAKALSDQNPGVGVEAAVALLRIDPRHREAGELLQRDLKGADSDARQAAADGLLAAGVSIEPAVRVLLDVAHQGEKMDRFGALRSLRDVRPEHVAAIPLLVEALADADADVRTSAAIGLGHIGPAARTAASPKLQRMSKEDTQESVRTAATHALDALNGATAKPR